MCIYEDQIGKFDWRQTYVGRIKFAQFDTVSTAKRIIVATEENVLAALNLKTGQVVWRHVFESASSGNIQLLHVGEKITTVTGSNPYLVRGWDSASGVLMWEWTLALQNDQQAVYSEWWVQNNKLVHLLPVIGSHLEVTMYNLLTGSNRGATSKLPAVWNNDGCVLTAPYYTCVSGNMGSQILLSLDVTSNVIQIISKPLSNFINLKESIGGNLRPLDNSVVPGFIVDDKKVLLIKENSFEAVGKELVDEMASATVIDGGNEQVLLQTWQDDEKGFQLTAYSISTNSEVTEIQCSDPTMSIPEAEFLAVMCSRKAKEQYACRLLVNAADDALHLMQQGGRSLWTREEALANVVTAEFVDLPVSDTEAAIESEFDQKEGSVWSAFSRRLHTQYTQLQNLIRNLQGQSAPEDSTNALVRDYFNLHKIMVLITEAGKKLHALVLLDEDETVQVFPISAAPLVENLYMYVAEKETGKVQGYALKYNGVSVEAQRTWSVQLGGPGPAQIVAVATRSRLERVRSPGRALADRSVLYKYSNPNLVLFVVEKPDPTHKEVVTAVVLDAVTGALLGASSHRRARALPLAVHADNCFAYLYRSEKHRRLEIATLELYEGQERWLEPDVAFSSFASDRAPAVERQAYILPATAAAAAFTITERSLADRHVLLGLTTGAVIEIPWAYLEARRGLTGGDEALLPYTPELPLPSEASLNYNRTVERVRGVLTAPAGLESTSLVLVTGLDLFYTRVAPSKTFDLLKDDFDYYLITIVLGALIVATYSTKYFASRKMLKLAWK
ncbi:jg19142 [Pararge aegeria aegeria]|uniref:ER membrane protein complex subunit 1 n=1 Tax=Pararge aegeria aegeria TaxID=348720 RepID=A0A8S4RPR5_9NEOP|nr:jg19142 [Pararge aegeria aegeria]